MSVSDAAILRALCCGRGPCRSPGGCSVAEGAHPRNLLVWVEDALPALRALMDGAGERSPLSAEEIARNRDALLCSRRLRDGPGPHAWAPER